MPRLIDRDAHAGKVLPVVVRLMAAEGLHAASYRRVALESGLSVAAVRNMWQTQEKLHQRAAVSLMDILFRPPPTWTADTVPDELIRDALLAILPMSAEQQVAHRAWIALRQSPSGGVLHECAERLERTRLTRVCLALTYADWLRLPAPRPGMKILAQDYARLDTARLDQPAALLVSLVAGISDALARPVLPVAPDTARRWVRWIDVPLLD
jgi:AcrR family transcriptional regulator